MLVVWVFFAVHAMPPIDDAADFDEVARRLLTDFPGHTPYYWPPGMPLLLASAYSIFGAHVLVTRAVTCMVGLACVVLTGLVTRRVAPRSTRAALWLAALYPPAVMLSGQPFSQQLAGLCMLGLTYWGLRALEDRRSGYALLAGLSLGLGCITRPSMVSLVVLVPLGVVAAWRWFPGRLATLQLGGVLLIGAGVIVAPVLAFNQALGAGPVISTNNERNFFLGNNPYTHDYKTSHLAQRSVAELPPEVQVYLARFSEDPDSRRAMQAEAFRYIRQHPLRTLYRCMNRTAAFWGFDYLSSRLITEYFHLGRPSFLVLLTVEAGGYLLVAFFAIAAFVRFRRAFAPVWLWGAISVGLAYQLPYSLAFSGGTYHFPVMWLAIPFAASTLRGVREDGAAILAHRGLWAAWCGFALLQAQYAYYAIAMSR